jgi:drug/metabolite transporter (DMT)-like permease
MTTRTTDHRKGLMITAVGGMLLTLDAPLLILSGANTANILFVRGLMVTFALVVWWWFIMRPKGEPFFHGRESVIAGILSCIQNLCFVGAIMNTSVANVVFILAFNPMFAALLSWLVLGERITRATFFAMVASMVGVAIIVWDGIGAGTLFGDFLALGCAAFLAITLTYSRYTGKDMSMMPAIGMGLSAMVAAPFASPLSLSAQGFGWLSLNGFLVAPASFALLALGPRYILAAEVAMFYLLETCLTPVLMWLIFAELPTTASLIGGGIIFGSLLLHSLYLLFTSRRPGFAQ